MYYVLLSMCNYACQNKTGFTIMGVGMGYIVTGKLYYIILLKTKIIVPFIIMFALCISSLLQVLKSQQDES